MLTTTNTRTINATSKVSVGESEKVVVNMNATIAEDGRVNLNTYMQDVENYQENKASVDADILAFIKSVYEMED